jgi:hypothetical protein
MAESARRCTNKSPPTVSAGRDRRYAPEQDGGRDLQRVCQSKEGCDARITKSALDPRDLGRVDTRPMADLFLREVPPLSRSGDVLRKDIEGGHPYDALVKLA